MPRILLLPDEGEEVLPLSDVLHSPAWSVLPPSQDLAPESGADGGVDAFLLISVCPGIFYPDNGNDIAAIASSAFKSSQRDRSLTLDASDGLPHSTSVDPQLLGVAPHETFTPHDDDDNTEVEQEDDEQQQRQGFLRSPFGVEEARHGFAAIQSLLEVEPSPLQLPSSIMEPSPPLSSLSSESSELLSSARAWSSKKRKRFPGGGSGGGGKTRRGEVIQAQLRRIKQQFPSVEVAEARRKQLSGGFAPFTDASPSPSPSPELVSIFMEDDVKKKHKKHKSHKSHRSHKKHKRHKEHKERRREKQRGKEEKEKTDRRKRREEGSEKRKEGRERAKAHLEGSKGEGHQQPTTLASLGEPSKPGPTSTPPDSLYCGKETSFWIASDGDSTCNAGDNDNDDEITPPTSLGSPPRTTPVPPARSSRTPACKDGSVAALPKQSLTRPKSTLPGTPISRAPASPRSQPLPLPTPGLASARPHAEVWVEVPPYLGSRDVALIDSSPLLPSQIAQQAQPPRPSSPRPPRTSRAPRWTGRESDEEWVPPSSDDDELTGSTRSTPSQDREQSVSSSEEGDFKEGEDPKAEVEGHARRPPDGKRRRVGRSVTVQADDDPSAASNNEPAPSTGTESGTCSRNRCVDESSGENGKEKENSDTLSDVEVLDARFAPMPSGRLRVVLRRSDTRARNAAEKRARETSPQDEQPIPFRPDRKRRCKSRPIFCSDESDKGETVQQAGSDLASADGDDGGDDGPLRARPSQTLQQKHRPEGQGSDDDVVCTGVILRAPPPAPAHDAAQAAPATIRQSERSTRSSLKTQGTRAVRKLTRMNWDDFDDRLDRVLERAGVEL